MISQTKSHNELISQFLIKLRLGELGDYDLAEIFSGKVNQPIQMALRHKESLRVILVEMNRDGTVRPYRQTSD